jgi:ABC-type Na+ efflux pump permease subunit
LLLGPVFARELTIAPRRPRIYVARTAYVAGLLLLTGTAWMVLTGTQAVRDIGDLARFGSAVFQILAPLQLALAVFFSAMTAAIAVAQEKDRRTMVLLLLTRLSSVELVLGKLVASLLQLLVMVVAALPLFLLIVLLGGVSFAQVGRVFTVTVASILVCGSLGSTLALWREKTFQALAATVLVLVLWLALGEVLASGMLGDHLAGFPAAKVAVVLSPWQAILVACRPHLGSGPAGGSAAAPLNVFLLISVALATLLNGLAIARVRAWNLPTDDQALGPEPPSAANSARSPAQAVGGGKHTSLPRSRKVWDNPVLWREVRTWAYGRKILVLRMAYLAAFAVAASYLTMYGGHGLDLIQAATALVPLFLLSLILVNSQAVTSLTAERDAKALDLLLVTDLTPKEIVFGKLGGVLYNTKEMVVLPLLLCVYLAIVGAISVENLLYLLGGLAVLYIFVTVLGLHAGMIYDNSRAAIATSLGTVFFLFLGIATCMRMMVAFSGSFNTQLQPFLAFMIGGGLGLYSALGARNPSTAIGVASFLCPFATFYAVTSFLLGYTLNVFLVVAISYGFSTAAMLIPAIYEFDVATGRTIAEEG